MNFISFTHSTKKYYFCVCSFLPTVLTRENQPCSGNIQRQLGWRARCSPQSSLDEDKSPSSPGALSPLTSRYTLHPLTLPTASRDQTAKEARRAEGRGKACLEQVHGTLCFCYPRLLHSLQRCISADHWLVILLGAGQGCISSMIPL